MIIADTGFWVALLDRRDNLHARVRAKAARLTEPLITTVPVVTEVCYLLQTRRGPEVSAQFPLAQQDGLFRLFSIEESHLPRMAELMRQYANLPMDFADASLVILAEYLGHGRIVSIDQPGRVGRYSRPTGVFGMVGMKYMPTLLRLPCCRNPGGFIHKLNGTVWDRRITAGCRAAG